MQEENGFVELLDTLRWRWQLAALIAAGIFFGAIVYVEQLPSEYEATAVLALAPRPDSGATSDTVRIVAPKYVAFLSSPQTAADTAEDLGTSASVVEDALDATTTPDSGNLTITATTRSPQLSTDIANALLREALTFSAQDELLSGEVVVRAVTSDRPSGPPRKLLEAAALLVGLIVGITVALLVERGRPRIRVWRDITNLTGYTVIARVPAARILRAKPVEAFADARVGPAFRTLRTNIERLGTDDQGLRTIAVTSALPSAGKTTTAALLGESLARLGNKTLVVDADLSRAGLTNTFGLDSREHGTSTVLRRTSRLEQAVQPGWVENLFVLPTQIDREAGDVIAREFGQLVAEVSAAYDTIIFDTPPLISTDEGRTIATQVEGVILVVRAGEMSGQVNEAVLALEDLKVRVLGVVGNRMRRADVGQGYR